MIVHIPSPLRSYTNDKSKVEMEGATVRELLENLDRDFPGFRFRIIDEQDGIRKHIKIFRNTDMITTIDTTLGDVKDVHIICALSGG